MKNFLKKEKENTSSVSNNDDDKDSYSFYLPHFTLCILNLHEPCMSAAIKAHTNQFKDPSSNDQIVYDHLKECTYLCLECNNKARELFSSLTIK